MAMCRNRIETVCIAWTRPLKECTSMTKLPPTQQSSWCFESRRKPFMRRRHLFVPHRFLTPQIHAEYVLHNRPTAVQTWSVYFPCVHAALVRLVGSSSPKGAAWGQLSKPWARGWFVVSDEHLIKGEYLQSLAHGRSSNDEAQAWGCGWTKVGRFECVPSFAAVRKEGLKLSCAHRKRRTEYQARDAARGQSQ